MTAGERYEDDLPETSWEVFFVLSGVRVLPARGAGGRAALEVYQGARLLDVAVAHDLAPALLRCALRGGRGTGAWALAWGRLPAGGAEPAVGFAAGRERRPAVPTIIAGAFWVAEVRGRFRTVAVTAGPERVAGRLRRADVPGR